LYEKRSMRQRGNSLKGRAMRAWIQLNLDALFDGAFFFTMRRPRLMRYLAGLLRRLAPVFAPHGAFFAGRTFLLTRADDCREILDRREDFLLGPVNERKILSGDFMISLDPERRYRREKEIVHQALPADRLVLLEDIVDAAADAQLGAPIANPFEAAEFAERVTVAIVERFWGLRADGARSDVVDAPEGQAHAREVLRLWLRKLAIVLGSRETGNFGIREVGERCNEEFFAFVRQECGRRTQAAPGNDMIGHIFRESRWDPDVTARNVAALTMTGSAVVTKAFCHAFDQLLRHRDALDRARQAARRSLPNRALPAEREQVGRLLVEALRFNPVFPILPRYCPRAATIAAGTPRETEIPAGSNVVVGAIGAMFDPLVVEEPERFGFGRDLQLNEQISTPDWRYGSRPDGTPGVYMLFGGGEHWCFGDQMAVAEMAGMAIALLRRLDNPRRTGALGYDGSAAAHFRLAHGA
jgi:cytochrome P450